jgi:hypothetical protein
VVFLFIKILCESLLFSHIPPTWLSLARLSYRDRIFSLSVQWQLLLTHMERHLITRWQETFFGTVISDIRYHQINEQLPRTSGSQVQICWRNRLLWCCRDLILEHWCLSMNIGEAWHALCLMRLKTVVTYKEGVSCIADHHVTWLPNMGCRMLPDRMELTADVRGKTGNCITVVKTF